MTKILSLICKSTDCKGQIRNYEYSYDQIYLNSEKLYEIFECPICHRQEGNNFTDFYFELVGVKDDK